MIKSEPPVELTNIEVRLRDAFVNGERLDLRNEPARAVRAEVIARLLAPDQSATANGLGALRLTGATITGRLDLEGMHVRHVIDLDGCRFELAPNLRTANLVGLRLRRCHTPGLSARNVRVGGDLALDAGFSSRGVLDLTDATIDGSVRLAGAVLRAPSDVVLLGARLRVGGSIQASALRASGEVRLRGAHIAGSLHLTAASLLNPTGIALEATGVVVDGSVLCDNDAGWFRAEGRMLLGGAQIGGDLVLSGAHLTAPPTEEQSGLVLPRGWAEEAPALLGDRMRVVGNAELDAGFTADGAVRLVNASIGGFLRLRGAVLGRKDLVHAVTANGGQQGDLPVPVALVADGLELGGDLDARADRRTGGPPLLVYGQVRLSGAHVGGSASLSGAELHCHGMDALFADRLAVNGTLFLQGVRAMGSIRLQNTRIGATLDCTDAKLTEPRRREDRSSKPSLDIQFAVIGRNLFCSKGVVATGGVSARLAEVRNAAHFSEAELGDGTGDNVAINGYGFTAHRLVLRFSESSPPRGAVRLEKAHVRVLVDGPGLWAAVGEVEIEDFDYESVHGENDVKVRLRWLRHVQPDFAPGPYDHLVNVYRNAGEEDEARKVLFEKQRRRYTELNLPGRIWGAMQEYTVGYGYRPWLAVLWLAVFWGMGTVWFSFNEMDNLDADQNPVWNPPLLAVDMLLPIVDLGHDRMWRMVGLSQWVAGVLIAVGWILASTVAAGAARVLKRN